MRSSTKPSRVLLAAAGILAGALPALASAGELWLVMDKFQRHRFDRPVGKVVVANPAIADVQVISATEMMLLGRAHGVTGMTFFDREGQVMDELRVRVGNDNAGTVTLQNGLQRYTYSCTDRCQPTLALGDGSPQFGASVMSAAQGREAAMGQEAAFGSQTVAVPAPAAAAPTASGETES